MAEHRVLLRSAALLAMIANAAAGLSLAESDTKPTTTPDNHSLLDFSDSLRLTLDGAYLYGPAKGHIETGAKSRPSFGDLGMNDVNIFDTSLTVGKGHQEVFIGGQFISMSGTSAIDEPLVIQNTSVPTGGSVDAEVALNWYRTGYRYWFLFDTNDAPGKELAIAPSVGAGCFDFTYGVTGPDGVESEQTERKLTPQVGVEAEWKLGQRFSMVAGVLTSVSTGDAPFILSTRLAGRYRIADTHWAKIDAIAGVGYERLQYDPQHEHDLPNDIEGNLGPLLLLGVRAQF